MKILLWAGASIFILISTYSSSFTQQEIPIGSWKSHLPFNRGIDVAVANDNVYYASDFGLFKLPADDFWNFQFITRVDGLNDAEPKLIRYQQKNNVLILVYENANIDLIFESEIRNIPDIMTTNIIFGERHINNIAFGDDNSIYFSCSFGLVQFDLEDLSFGFSVITGSEVFDFSQWNDHFYMSTEQGIYRAPVDNFNHQDFTRWELLGSDYGLPSDSYSSAAIIPYDGQLVAAVDEEIYLFDGSEFFLHLSEQGYTPEFFNHSEGHLIIGWKCLENCDRGRAFIYDPAGNMVELASDCINEITHAELNSAGQIFVADRFRNYRFTNRIDANCNLLYPNSPYSANVSDMDIKDNVVYVAAGGVSANYGYRFRRDGFFTYKEGKWSVRNYLNTPELAEPPIFDLFQIKAHPNADRLYIGSFWRGLIVVEGDELTVFDSENSCLQKFVPENLRERISGMVFDPLNRLWVTNDGSADPIVMFDSEHNCYSFNVPNFKFLTQIDIDFNGFKWMAVRDPGAGLVVFHEGDLHDPSDERLAVLSSGNSNLPNNSVLSVKTDLNGSVWVGTTDGVVVFDCTSQVFDGNCPGNRRRVSVDGFIAELLEGERVQTIAVDGANRKWFGTTSGVFVQSPGGDEQVAFFDTDNSPLIDNNIINITINDQTGEVYIGTTSGIMSFRTDAVKGGTHHSSEVEVFPNPVRPEYDGPIAIRGLARDSRVKITDVRGNLVYEMVSKGGQAIWYGRDLEGRSVTSGVYMVFATNSGSSFEGPDGLVTKIMVVR